MGGGRGPGGPPQQSANGTAPDAQPRPGDRGPGGGGGFFGSRGIAPPKGVELDPLIGLDDAKKPLRSRLLAVPALRARYLAHVRTIAEDALDWNKLAPLVARYRALIEKEVEADTRKLDSFAAFQKATADSRESNAEPEQPGRRPESMSLRAFAEQRRAYLLDYSEGKVPGEQKVPTKPVAE